MSQSLASVLSQPTHAKHISLSYQNIGQETYVFSLTSSRSSAYFVLPIDKSMGVTSVEVSKSDQTEEVVIYGGFSTKWPCEQDHEEVLTFHRSTHKLIFYIQTDESKIAHPSNQPLRNYYIGVHSPLGVREVRI